jgi:hypothetical protein
VRYRRQREYHRTERTSAAKAARLLAVVLATGAGAAACGATPFVLDGDADYVRVTYAGDMESATAAATRHCAQFERVPRLREIEESVAFFFCVRP